MAWIVVVSPSRDRPTVSIQHDFGKQVVIRNRPTDMAFATREKIFYRLLRIIAQTLPCIHTLPVHKRGENITDQTGVEAT